MDDLNIWVLEGRNRSTDGGGRRLTSLTYKEETSGRETSL